MEHSCRYVFLFVVFYQCLEVFSYISQAFPVLVADGVAVEVLLLGDLVLLASGLSV